MTLTDDPVKKNPNSMRDKFFQEYSEIFEEHQLLKKERQEVLKEIEILKIEKERMEDTIYEMERKFNKAINDLELTTSLLNEQKKKNNTLVATVGKL
jgi:DNA polymerase III delta prime subunit